MRTDGQTDKRTDIQGHRIKVSGEHLITTDTSAYADSTQTSDADPYEIRIDNIDSRLNVVGAQILNNTYLVLHAEIIMWN